MVPSMYHTVAVWGHRGTIGCLDGDTLIKYVPATDFRISLTVTMCDMTKYAPVPDFKIVCTWTQMIVKDLFDQSRQIQLL